jgi:hypothetical protein
MLTGFQSWDSFKDLFFPLSRRYSAIGCGQAAELLRENKETYRTMTPEMGKPVTESISKIETCISECEFYAENARR